MKCNEREKIFDLITDSFVRLCIGPREKALQKETNGEIFEVFVLIAIYL